MDEYSFEAKQADLEKLLVELSASSSVCEDEKERIRIEKQFTNIYNGTWRHSYSSIFSVLMDMFREDRSKLEILSNNLKYIVHSDQLKGNTKKKVVKLQDHVDLEVARILAWFGEHKDIQDKHEDLKRQVDTVEVKTEKTKEELDSIQINYITILGIFASIVLAFSGSISFSNSVFSNLANASIIQIGLSCAIQGLIFINLLYILVSTILYNLKPDVTAQLKKHIQHFNLWFIILLLFFSSMGVFFNYYRTPHQVVKEPDIQQTESSNNAHDENSKEACTEDIPNVD